jgi:hypothetical protein
MDYAAESIGYEEYEAAKTDLCRSRRGVGEAVTLLTSHTGIKAPRAPFRWRSRRLSRGRSERPSRTAATEAVATQAQEPAEPKHSAQIIHLLPTQEAPCPPPQRPRLILL